MIPVPSRTKLRPLVCCLLSFLTAVNSCLSLHAFSKNPGAAAHALSLPGYVVDSSSSSSPERVFVIYDRHGSPSAQRNISRILETLHEAYGLEEIYMEGAPAGKVNCGLLSPLAGGSTGEKALDMLLENDLLSGAELTACRSRKFSLNGIEDPALYSDNLFRYRDIVMRRRENLNILNALERELVSVRKQYMTTDAARSASLLTGGMSRLLRKARIDTSSVASRYPQLSLYSDIEKIRKKTSFSGVAADEENVLKILAARLPYDRYAGLVSLIGPEEDDAAFLERLAREAKTVIPGFEHTYPRIAARLRYLTLDRSLNPFALLKEECDIQRSIFFRRPRSLAERELYVLSDNIRCLKHYAELSITSDELTRLRAEHDEFVVLLSKYIHDDETRQAAIRVMDDPLLRVFHETNLLRNDVFLSALSDSLKSKKQFHEGSSIPPVALVIGGFHADVARRLREKGIAYTAIVPKSGNDYDQYRYEKALTRSSLFVKGMKSVYAHSSVHAVSSAIPAPSLNAGTPDAAARVAESIKRTGGSDTQATLDRWLDDPRTKEWSVETGIPLAPLNQEVIFKDEGPSRPAFLAANIEAAGRRIFSCLSSDILMRKLNALSLALEEAVIHYGVKGAHSEYLVEPKRNEARMLAYTRRKLAAYMNIPENGVSVELFDNPLLVNDENDYTMAVLGKCSDGKYVLYINSYLLSEILAFRTLPGYSSKMMLDLVVQHEADELNAFNDPKSPIFHMFHDYAREHGLPLTHHTYHCYLSSIDSPQAALLSYAAEVAGRHDGLTAARRTKKSFARKSKERIVGEHGLILNGKPVSYARTVKLMEKKYGSRFDLSDTVDVMDDTYEAVWTKLKAVDVLKGPDRLVDAGIQVQGTLTWYDAIVKQKNGTRRLIHSHQVFFHPASPESEVFEGLRRLGLLPEGVIARYFNNAIAALKAGGAETDVVEAMQEIKAGFAAPGLPFCLKKVNAAKALRSRVNKNDIRGNEARAAFTELKTILQPDYLSAFIDQVLSPDSLKQTGTLDTVDLVFDTRGHEAIKLRIKEEAEKIATFKSTGLPAPRINIRFIEEIAPMPDTMEKISSDINAMMESYEGALISTLVEGAVYSRYVGLLLELKTILTLDGFKCEILQSGRDVHDAHGLYITELDLVVRDPDGKVSIVECKSCRTGMSNNHVLRSKVIGKLKTYRTYAGDIHRDIGAGFDQVVFAIDPGGNTSLVAFLKNKEEELSKEYGFPVRFLFLRSNPETFDKNTVITGADAFTHSFAGLRKPDTASSARSLDPSVTSHPLSLGDLLAEVTKNPPLGIALDMDITLVPKGRIYPASARIIRALSELSIHMPVAIITGRPILEPVRTLLDGASPDYTFVANGGTGYKGDELIHQKDFTAEDKERIVEAFKAMLKKFRIHGDITVKNNDLMVTVLKEDYREKIVPWIIEELAGMGLGVPVFAGMHDEHHMDIFASPSDKAHALLAFSAAAGIPIGRIAFIGDSHDTVIYNGKEYPLGNDAATHGLMKSHGLLVGKTSSPEETLHFFTGFLAGIYRSLHERYLFDPPPVPRKEGPDSPSISVGTGTPQLLASLMPRAPGVSLREKLRELDLTEKEALVRYGFQGVNGEFRVESLDPARAELVELFRTSLARAMNTDSSRIIMTVSNNPALTENRYWSLATLSPAGDGKTWEYCLHDLLLEKLIHYPPQGHSLEDFTDLFSRHEWNEYTALHDAAGSFHSVREFHKHLFNAGSPQVDVLIYAFGIIRQHRAERALGSKPATPRTTAVILAPAAALNTIRHASPAGISLQALTMITGEKRGAYPVLAGKRIYRVAHRERKEANIEELKMITDNGIAAMLITTGSGRGGVRAGAIAIPVKGTTVMADVFLELCEGVPVANIVAQLDQYFPAAQELLHSMPAEEREIVLLGRGALALLRDLSGGPLDPAHNPYMRRAIGFVKDPAVIELDGTESGFGYPLAAPDNLSDAAMFEQTVFAYIDTPLVEAKERLDSYNVLCSLGKRLEAARRLFPLTRAGMTLTVGGKDSQFLNRVILGREEAVPPAASDTLDLLVERMKSRNNYDRIGEMTREILGAA